MWYLVSTYHRSLSKKQWLKWKGAEGLAHRYMRLWLMGNFILPWCDLFFKKCVILQVSTWHCPVRQVRVRVTWENILRRPHFPTYQEWGCPYNNVGYQWQEWYWICSSLYQTSALREFEEISHAPESSESNYTSIGLVEGATNILMTHWSRNMRFGLLEHIKICIQVSLHSLQEL